MNKIQQDILFEKFKQQQKLEEELFNLELKTIGDTMDYKEEMMEIGQAMFNTRESIRKLKEKKDEIPKIKKNK